MDHFSHPSGRVFLSKPAESVISVPNQAWENGEINWGETRTELNSDATEVLWQGGTRYN
jgi:hypothetical protein